MALTRLRMAWAGLAGTQVGGWVANPSNGLAEPAPKTLFFGAGFLREFFFWVGTCACGDSKERWERMGTSGPLPHILLKHLSKPEPASVPITVSMMGTDGNLCAACIAELPPSRALPPDHGDDRDQGVSCSCRAQIPARV